VRRLFWLAAGAGAGATGAVMTARWAREQRRRMAPTNVARLAGAGLRDLSTLVRSAAREFVDGAAAREAEIRASLPAGPYENDGRLGP
jgi:hypothetical protein